MNNEILIAILLVSLIISNLLKSRKIDKLKRKILSLDAKNKWLIKLKKQY
jgi:hypothetical protein|tara:strand:+ start:29 stop:178 length:150 start_codon:yes stop_codon:yes gene_type:complete